MEHDDLGSLAAAPLPSVQYGEGLLTRGEDTSIQGLLNIINQYFQVQFGEPGFFQGWVSRAAQCYYRYAVGKPKQNIIGLDSAGHKKLGFGLH
jgi:hypothetical protein